MHEWRIRTAPRSRKLIAPAIALLLFAGLAGTASAKKHPPKHPPKHHPKHHPKQAPKPGVVGAMYAETNNGSANQLLVFDRYSNGVLKLRQSVATGGKGGLQPEPGCTPPGGCPLLDAQGEVQATTDGKLVFAVNAGSNTISSFRAGKSVTLASQVPSGGIFPNSVTIHGNVLYVLNTNSENISGFRFSNDGTLTPISGSTQSLTAEAAPLSRQIGFDNSGNVLVVSLLTNAAFDTFNVVNDVAGPATAHPSATPEPFAFSFAPGANTMFAAEVVNDQDFTQASNASSYSLSSAGGLTKLDTVSTQGYAACWTQITKNGQWLFVVNTGGPSPFGATVTTFALSPTSGQLTFKGVTAKADSFTLTDEALSRDDKYLYVVAPLINNPFVTPPPATNGSKIVEFKVGSDGTLTKIGETTEQLAPGVSGLAGN
jgi:6-phosphogluconolactonase